MANIAVVPMAIGAIAKKEGSNASAANPPEKKGISMNKPAQCTDTALPQDWQGRDLAGPRTDLLRCVSACCWQWGQVSIFELLLSKFFASRAWF